MLLAKNIARSAIAWLKLCENLGQDGREFCKYVLHCSRLGPWRIREANTSIEPQQGGVSNAIEDNVEVDVGRSSPVG